MKTHKYPLILILCAFLPLTYKYLSCIMREADIFQKNRMEVQARMATKDRWITDKEAAAILTRNTDHEVSADYVRMLARMSKIEYRAKDGRTNEYSLSSVEAYHVRPQGTPRVRPRPSTRKQRISEEAKEEASNAA